MKKKLSILVILSLVLMVSACTSGGSDGPSKQSPIYADFSNGVDDPSLIKEYTLSYDGDLTAKKLAEGLTGATGYDFFINDAVIAGGKITVDWSASSTLVSGYDGRDLKEDFKFESRSQTYWFMMDSLYTTLTKTLGVKEVYYTMNSGRVLEPDPNGPTITFDLDTPYMGSIYYHANFDLTSDADDASLNIPSLVGLSSFTGLTPLETDNNYNGGYYYSSITEDGLTTIINTAFTSTFMPDSMTIEDYVATVASEISIVEVRNLTVALDDIHTERLSYPVYIASWVTGENEDTKHWESFILNTDTHTYVYIFSTPVSHIDENIDFYHMDFEFLELY